MVEATTQIPVLWETTQEVADRLLGKSGRPLLERTLELARNLAAERNWPLKSVKVTHYEDPEVVWEYLLLVLVFDCGPEKAMRLWDEYLNAIEEAIEDMYQGLNASERAIFANMIDYEFRSNP